MAITILELVNTLLVYGAENGMDEEVEVSVDMGDCGNDGDRVYGSLTGELNPGGDGVMLLCDQESINFDFGNRCLNLSKEVDVLKDKRAKLEQTEFLLGELRRVLGEYAAKKERLEEAVGQLEVDNKFLLGLKSGLAGTGKDAYFATDARSDCLRGPWSEGYTIGLEIRDKLISKGMKAKTKADRRKSTKKGK